MRHLKFKGWMARFLSNFSTGQLTQRRERQWLRQRHCFESDTTSIATPLRERHNFERETTSRATTSRERQSFKSDNTLRAACSQLLLNNYMLTENASTLTRFASHHVDNSNPRVHGGSATNVKYKSRDSRKWRNTNTLFLHPQAYLRIRRNANKQKHKEHKNCIRTCC